MATRDDDFTVTTNSKSVAQELEELLYRTPGDPVGERWMNESRAALRFVAGKARDVFGPDAETIASWLEREATK